ncbi:Pre-rRNA-processing protein TSR2-domain-containing protein [Xylariaceae sp. FL0016]|nr:Pre-rRNA-processing protein TSR2-domain-containing protein [Xylariaceae sp. FL0016]
MASTAQSGPSPETRQSNFEQGVAISLHLWLSLTIAVQNNWGGPDSADKRDWLAGVVSDMYPSFPSIAKLQAQGKKIPDDPTLEDVEETLVQVMWDEFEAHVDDESERQVAERIVKCHTACVEGDFSLIEELRSRWLDTKGKKIVVAEKVAADQDTDWEDDDEDDDGDDDVEMGGTGEDAPGLVAVVKEKPAPEIDEDGFEKVVRRKR